MTIAYGSFTATTQESITIRVAQGSRFICSLEGTWTGIVAIRQRRFGGGWTIVCSCTEAGVHSYDADYDSEFSLYAAEISSGTATYRIEDADRSVEVGNFEWDDLRFPAQAINPAGAVAPPGVDTTETDFPGTLLFDAGTPEMVAGVAQMPHGYRIGSPIYPHIHWAKTTSASGGVVWHFYYRIVSRTGASGAWVGPVVGVDELPHADTADREAITTFGAIPATGIGLSQMLAWRIYRKADDVADTYAADARLLEFDIHYQKDSIGSGGEFMK